MTENTATVLTGAKPAWDAQLGAHSGINALLAISHHHGLPESAATPVTRPSLCFKVS